MIKTYETRLLMAWGVSICLAVMQGITQTSQTIQVSSWLKNTPYITDCQSMGLQPVTALDI